MDAALIYLLVGNYPSSPGSKSNQELNAQVISRRWYPRTKPAVGSTISVVNGLHCTNTTPTMQSGAITITAATRWIQTLVMSDADEYETATEATQLFSGGGEYVFTATTEAAPPLEDVSFQGDTDVQINGEATGW